MNPYRFKPLKPPKDFHDKSSSSIGIKLRFIQIIILSLGVLLESSCKAFRNFKNSKQSKFHRIQALKPRRTYTTNLIKSRKFEEHEDLSIHFPIKVKTISVQIKTTSTQYLNQRLSKVIESKDYSIALESKYRKLYLQIHQYKFTFVKHCQLFDFKLEILCLQTQRKDFDGGMFEVAYQRR